MQATLLMLLVVGDPQAEWIEGLRRALQTSLDAQQRLQLSSQTSQRELETSLERLVGDDTLCLAAVDFSRSGSRARIRVRPAHSSRWLQREVSFQESDAPTERGRALGFSLASMLLDVPAAVQVTRAAPLPQARSRSAAVVDGRPPPEQSLPPETATTASAESDPPRPTPAEPQPPTPAAPPVSPLEPAAPSAAAETSAAPIRLPIARGSGQVELREAAPEARDTRWSLDAAGQGSWGLGRSTPEGGARLAAQLRLGRFAARAGGFFLRGALPEASATTTAGGPFVGAAIVLVEGRLNAAARLDVSAAYLSVARGGEEHGRWLVSAQPRVEGTVVLAEPLSAVLAVGADIGLSSTRVFVEGEQQATIDPVSFAAELGVRVAF